MRTRYSRISNLGIVIMAALLMVQQGLAADSFEPRLIESLNALQFQDDSISEAKIKELIEDYPNSQTAHLLMADLLAVRAGVIDPFALRERYKQPEALRQLDGLRDEVKLRWNQMTNAGPAEKGLIPASVIQLSPGRKSIIVVDAARARLYTYSNLNGKLSLAMHHYSTIAKAGTHKRQEGDNRTPIGVYHVTRYIDDKDLPPLYGNGAFPINYPNELDRHYGRTGYGIWLHGTHPDSFNRVPLETEGCVAMSNPDFDLLKSFVEPQARTTVIINDQINWVKPEHLAVTRDFFQQLLDNWVNDWESLDPQRYLSHYDRKAFFSRDHNFDSWAKHKTAVNASKTKIDVKLNNLSLFAYPGEKDMVVAEFTQNYSSNNFDSESEKRQYWRRNPQGEWKIIYEGSQ